MFLCRKKNCQLRIYFRVYDCAEMWHMYDLAPSFCFLCVLDVKIIAFVLRTKIVASSTRVVFVMHRKMSHKICHTIRTELQKSCGYAGTTREEGLPYVRSLRKISTLTNRLVLNQQELGIRSKF